MASSLAHLRSGLATTSFRDSKFFSIGLNGGDKRSPIITFSTKKRCAIQIITSVMGNRSSINDNGASESARPLLERLFEQTQKLEEQMIGNSHLADDVGSVFDLTTLESDLLAALEALKKKEEDLYEAENAVLLELAELNRAKEEFERRTQSISLASSKMGKLEEETRLASLKLTSQAKEIEDLRVQANDRNQEIVSLQSILLSKEEELGKVRNDLTRKSEELSMAESELKLKAQLLIDAQEIVNRQESEILVLQTMLCQKENDLEVAVEQCRLENEKVKAAEAALSKQTMDWLLAQEELKKLGEQTSRHMDNSNSTMEEFLQVKRLLSDVRTELVSSQQSLSLSRQKMEQRDLLIDKQLEEVEEQKTSIVSYMDSLKDAQKELEIEKLKHTVAESRNKELEQQLLLEREQVDNLQDELYREKTSFEEANKEISLLHQQLQMKETELEETQNLLERTNKELADAKIEIQLLKLEMTSLQHALKEKDSEVHTARLRLEEVNVEVADLKSIMKSKEDQLIQVTTLLREKEDHAHAIESELNLTILKCNEAERVVERILNLTNELVVAVKENDYSSKLSEYVNLESNLRHISEEPADGYSYRWDKQQLEAELKLTRENLKTKELEVLAMKRSLENKEEELITVFKKVEEKDEDLKKAQEEAHRDAVELNLYAMAQERINGKTVDDLAIEKLQLEAAQLEVEAATSALDKLTIMSRELVNQAASGADEADYFSDISSELGSSSLWTNVEENNDNGSLIKLLDEVTHLTLLTQRLVQEAGIC